MSPKIFISYRRADSQDFTDRLFDYMVKHFGTENVFQDVGDSSKIPPGVDFAAHLAEQVKRCDVVLVVIGDQWTRILQERAAQRDDFVRIEVESALAQKKIVIPVLKSATQMPASHELPESINSLARRNASRVRPNPDFSRDCDTLAEGIRAVFALQVPSTPAAIQPTVTETPTKQPSNNLELLPPPFAWVSIPTGKVTLEQGGYLETATVFDVPAFQIAKYPVTNAQFRLFIEAGGYSNKKWWTSEGWQEQKKARWVQPLFWDDAKFNSADCPVVGVSWFEAIAFCSWLHEVTGLAVMLPSEQQWQRAAQGDDDREYPWGNLWEDERCQHSIRGMGSTQTASVQQYEGRGDSPYGVVDMVGNVQEWCLTVYLTGRQDPDDSPSATRLVRSGAWRDNITSYFRVSYRGDAYPDDRYNFRGFRLVSST